MVKIVEQYTTKLSSEEHSKMQEAVKWLNENGFLSKTNKYEVTKYALQTLIGIVDNKKKKLEEDSKLAKELQEKNIGKGSGEKPAKEAQGDLSSGEQDA